jgi:hypothetical protein
MTTNLVVTGVRLLRILKVGMHLNRNLDTCLYARPTPINGKIAHHHSAIGLDPHLMMRIVPGDPPATIITSHIINFTPLSHTLQFVSLQIVFFYPSSNETRTLSIPT